MSSRHLRHDTVMSGLTLQAPGDRVHSVVVTVTNSSRITTNLQWLQLVEMKLWEKSVEIMDRAAGAGEEHKRPTTFYHIYVFCFCFIKAMTSCSRLWATTVVNTERWPGFNYSTTTKVSTTVRKWATFMVAVQVCHIWMKWEEKECKINLDWLEAVPFFMLSEALTCDNG